MSFAELPPSRPVAGYCQLRLTKVVDGEHYHTVRWAPAAIALRPGPYGFRMFRANAWTDGWECHHPRTVEQRPRGHGSWDEWRVNAPGVPMEHPERDWRRIDPARLPGAWRP